MFSFNPAGALLIIVSYRNLYNLDVKHSRLFISKISMKTHYRYLACLTFVASFSLYGCGKGQILDFRNAQVINGKVYAEAANTPFSGTLTNVPAGQVLDAQKGFAKFAETTTRVIFPQLANIRQAGLSVSSNAMLLPNSYCDVSMNEGYLDGETVCKAPRSEDLTLKASFDKGTLVGAVKLYDPKTGKLLSETSFEEGQPDGAQNIYSPRTNKLVHTISWKNGILDGPEEGFDESTGKRTFFGTFSDGKYQGETTLYSSDSNNIIQRTTFENGLPLIDEKFDPQSKKLIARSEFKNGKFDGSVKKWDANGVLISDDKYTQGVLLSSSASHNAEQAGKNATSLNTCIDSWTTAYRKEQGEEAVISIDQINEWEAWCRSGKYPQ